MSRLNEELGATGLAPKEIVFVPARYRREFKLLAVHDPALRAAAFWEGFVRSESRRLKRRMLFIKLALLRLKLSIALRSLCLLFLDLPPKFGRKSA